MRRHDLGRAPSWPSLALGLLVLWGGPAARAQAPPVPDPSAPPPAASGPVTAREAQLEERVRQLEATVDRLSAQVERLSASPTAATAPAPGGAASPSPTMPAVPATDAGAGLRGSAASGGPAAAPPAPAVDMPAPNLSLPAKVKFGPGFQVGTEDDEYQFQFHNLTQLDGRFYEQGGQDPVRDTFTFPREWLIFSGRLTRPYEYFVATAFGFDSFNLLDAFLNVHYDDRLQFKIGRYKTPFTYEFYTEPINGLINPERSLFFNNFGLNRDLGLMAWGQDLFQKRLDYAVGIFNGTRNGFLNLNDAMVVASYLDVRPFGDLDGSALQFFHIGGSVFAGDEVNLPIPPTLRTNVATTGNNTLGIPFLSFNSWSLHTAWYYEQLSLIAEWQSGFQDYALASNLARRTNVPVQSFYAQAGYFLTGETVSARGAVKPLRPFDLRHGQFGPGAIELAGRYSTLDVGREVFTNGLADPGLWSNRAYLADLGINWYWTQYIKVYLGWEHGEFGDPVRFAPGRRQLTSDLFWFRFQVYF
jgi:phosphate-selective porin OprO and OprP